MEQCYTARSILHTSTNRSESLLKIKVVIGQSENIEMSSDGVLGYVV